MTVSFGGGHVIQQVMQVAHNNELDQARYSALMADWGEWCCAGRSLINGYPRAAAHVYDRVDHDSPGRLLADDYPTFEAVDRFVMTLGQVDKAAAVALGAYWEAQPRWQNLDQAKKATRLRVSLATFKQQVSRGNTSLQTLMISERFAPVLAGLRRVVSVV